MFPHLSLSLLFVVYFVEFVKTRQVAPVGVGLFTYVLMSKANKHECRLLLVAQHRVI